MQLLFIDLHCDATMPSGAKEFGGGNTYSRGLLKGIAKNDEIFCVYITRKKFNTLQSHEMISTHCHIERIELGDSSDDKDTLQNYTNEATEKIKTIISKYKLTDFIIHSSYWHSGIIALNLTNEYNTFYIHTIQSNGKKKKLVNSKQNDLDNRIKTEERVFNNAKYLICSSNSEKDEICCLYGIPTYKMVVTGLPIAEEFYFPAHDRYGTLSTYSITDRSVKSYLPAEYATDCLKSWWVGGPFLYYGRLHIDKGILEIVKAWNLLYNKYVENTPPLWIVGGIPKQIEEMRDMLVNENIPLETYEKQQKIIWWGTLTPADLSGLLTKSMVLVTHSKYESGGLMVLEAFACSTSVIATPYGYANDYIEDWFNGFIVDFGKVSLLAARMNLFVNNPYLSDLLGKNARIINDQFTENFDFLEIHFNLYKGLKFTCDNIPIEKHDKINYTLNYQCSLTREKIMNVIYYFCKGCQFEITDERQSNDATIIIFKVDSKFYQLNMWLTTLNEDKFLYNDEPYLISAIDKITSVAKFSKCGAFETPEYIDKEDKISIVRHRINESHPNVKDVIHLMEMASTMEFDLEKEESSLSEKIAIMLNLLDENSAIWDSATCQKFFKIFKYLYGYNNKREKLHSIATPFIFSLENIHNGKLYGVFRCCLSEYGHGIALTLLLTKTRPETILVGEADKRKRKSILAWYTYLRLEIMIKQMIISPEKALVLDDFILPLE